MDGVWTKYVAKFYNKETKSIETVFVYGMTRRDACIKAVGEYPRKRYVLKSMDANDECAS